MITKNDYLNIQRAVLELDEFKQNTHEVFQIRENNPNDNEFLNYHLIDNKKEFKELYVMSYYYGWIETERTFFKWNGKKLIEVDEEKDEELRKFDDEHEFFGQWWVYYLVGIDNDGTYLGKVEGCLK